MFDGFHHAWIVAKRCRERLNGTEAGCCYPHNQPWEQAAYQKDAEKNTPYQKPAACLLPHRGKDFRIDDRVVDAADRLEETQTENRQKRRE